MLFILLKEYVLEGMYTIKGQELRIGRSEIPASANC
jgi:hypothetical protein